MILLTFIGAGKRYEKTTYEWKDQRVKSQFSCAACEKFLKPELMIIFMTDQAKEDKLDALQKELDEIGSNYEIVMIPMGRNEEELWQIFDIITSRINEGSEIAFDVTNGLRSFPLLGILAAVFMKTGLDVKVSHLFYGAFDVKKEGEPTPVFDISPMLELLDWSSAAQIFNEQGDSRKLAALLEKFGKKYSRSNQDNREERDKGSSLSRLGKVLSEITDSYLMLRPGQIRDRVGHLEECITRAESDVQAIPSEKPLILLLERIRKKYLRDVALVSKDSGSIALLEQERNMIKWYWDHQHYVQAISLAREWIVSWVMVFADEPKENLSDQDVRKKYEHELGRLVNVTETQTGELPEEPEVDLSGIPDEVIQIWRKVPQIRNDIDHAGYRKEPLEAKKLIAQAEKIITEIRKFPLPDKG